MFMTGVAWLIADWQKSAWGGDVWQWSAAWLLMVHGGGAMATLLLLGALMPVHAYQAWRRRKNRVSGMVMLTLNAVLVVTSFGLYYIASETVRPWMSNIHIAGGFCLPFLFVLHIALGRRTRSG
jgi:heme A synthase